MPFPVVALPRRTWYQRATLHSLALFLFAGFTHLAAQPTPQTVVQMHGGFFNYDLMGVGTENYFAMNLAQTLHKRLAIKGSLTYTKTVQMYAARIPYLIPEVGIEMSKSLGFVKPYLGAGIGLVCDIRTDAPDSVSYVNVYGVGTQLQKSIVTDEVPQNTFDAAYYLELGLQIPLPNQVSAVVLSAKIRGHEIDVSGLSNEIGLGLATSF